MYIHMFGSARRISFVRQLPYKRNPSGRTEYMNIHTPPPPIKRLATALQERVLDIYKVERDGHDYKALRV